MARIPERKFDPAQPVIARKYFTANGRKYAPGALFDWRKDAISQRRVAQMFDAGKLKHDDITPERIKPEVTPERIDNPLESLDYYDAEGDDLDAIDDMKELRAIADEIGAGYKVSKVDQRQAIRDKRKEIE